MIQQPSDLSSSSDEEIIKAMGNGDDVQSIQSRPGQRLTYRRQRSNTAGASRPSKKHPSGTTEAYLISEQVAARCDLDGYYYRGKVVSQSKLPNRVIVQFDNGPLKHSDVLTNYCISLTGAVSRPIIRQGNTVLVLIKNGTSGLHCYVPGVVAISPYSDSAQAKCYTIIAYNRRSVTAFRYQLIKISEAQFKSVVAFIAEKAKMMGLKPIAPLSKPEHFGIKKKVPKDQQKLPYLRRRAQTTLNTSRKPAVSSSSSSIRSENVKKQSVFSSRSSSPVSLVERGIQSEENVVPVTPGRTPLESARTDRGVSPIHFADEVKQVKTIPQPDSTSSSSSESDNDGSVRPERRRRLFDRSASMDGAFKPGQTVLARSSEDGFFYRWKVEIDLGNGSYSLRNKIDKDDTEVAWKEHIFRLPRKMREDDSDDDDSNQPTVDICEGDFVLAKQPDFSHTYSPGCVEMVDRFNHAFEIRFSDGTVSKVGKQFCLKISAKSYNEAVMFIKHCDERWIGERVVVLAPLKEEGGLEPVAGNYIVGVVKQKEKNVNDKQTYLVEMAPEVKTLCFNEHKGLNDENNNEDLFMFRQSIDHIFGRFTKSRKLKPGDFVLAPSNHDHRIYLPGTVRAVKQNSKMLAVKLVNGLIVENLKAKDVFWLRSDYFDSAELFFKQKNLPHNGDVYQTGTFTEQSLEKSAPAPNIVIDDFDSGKVVAKEGSSKHQQHHHHHHHQSLHTKTSSSSVTSSKMAPVPSKDQISEMVKKCQDELESGLGIEQVMRWIQDGTVICSEKLADMAERYDSKLSTVIHLKAGTGKQKIFQQISSPDQQHRLLEGVLALDRDAAMKLATMMYESGKVDLSDMAEVLLANPKHLEQSIEFFLDTIDDEDPKNDKLETTVIEASYLLGKESLNRVLKSKKFKRYDRTRIAALCKKANLHERLCEQLQFVDEIKEVLACHAFEMDPEWLVEFFEKFQPDDMNDMIEEMLLSNKSAGRNVQVVTRLLKRHFKQIDINNIVALLERLKMTEELAAILQTAISINKNPVLLTKYIEVLCLVDRVSEAEQICKDPSNSFHSEAVWDFLQQAKLVKTGRLMAYIVDRFGYTDSFVRFCHANNQYGLLVAFVSRINPGKLHEIVASMNELGVEQKVIDRVTAAVSAPVPGSGGSSKQGNTSASSSALESPAEAKGYLD